MMENKICVYAICKNEMQFVDKWLASMSEADYIVVLDTGSDDGTYEYLQNDPRCYRVKQQVINPWRFDVARNESMKLVPDEANILVCTDLDELFVEGWAQSLRDQWIEGQHRRAYYKYAWNHATDGSPQLVFGYDKVHTRDYHWRFPVHEVLERNDGYIYPEDAEHGLQWRPNEILLHHYQDESKERSSYFPLLVLRLQENPNEPYSHYLLAREYGNMEMYVNAIEEFLKTINMPAEYRNSDVQMISYGYLGDCYAVLGEYTTAIEYYQKWINDDPTYLDPYCAIAEVYNNMKLYHKAQETILKGLETCTRHYSWLERPDTWREKPWDMLAIACYYTGEYDMGIQASQKAIGFCPDDVRILKNYIALLEKRYLNKED
jgi:tetratricopeptide (TPR) repeat protein